MAVAFVVADWLWVLPAAVRGLGLVAMAMLAIIPLSRALRRYGRDRAAVEIEAHFPELGQRLRTVVNCAAPGEGSVPASPGLIRALGRDTDRRTAGLDFRASPPRRAGAALVVLAFVLASVVITLLAFPGLRTAALRMLLVPVHYTNLDVKPGDVTLRAGEELTLAVTLSGRPVSSAEWRYREPRNDAGWVSAPLMPEHGANGPANPLSGTLTAGLKDCQTDLEYRVVAGELKSRVFHVKVVHPLVLNGVEAAITPPAYTRRPQEVVKSGNIQAIEGSPSSSRSRSTMPPPTPRSCWDRLRPRTAHRGGSRSRSRARG